MTLSPGFASVLSSGRADFNARFVAARRVYADLDADAFAAFLQSGVDELARAVEAVRADRLANVTQAAYDAALELAGQKLAGPGSRVASVEEAWRRVLPKAAHLVATAPARLIAAVCNAAHQLATTPGARPAQWVEAMAGIAPQCAEVEPFLQVGQVAAWRAGLAHFREGALAVGDLLPETLALAAVNAKPGLRWAEVRQRLLACPWFDPASDSETPAAPRIVAQAGAFRGFGGLFVEPPTVAATGRHFLARSGEECWLLTADAFGSTFHRATIGEFEAASRESRMPDGLQVNGSRVVVDGARFEVPAFGEFTSAAANSTTLAVTSRFTHSVVLVALK